MFAASLLKQMLAVAAKLWFNSQPDTVSFLMGMVEATGVEPVSEDNATQASTGVVT